MLRTAANVRQKELACELGVTANYLSLVENDHREPSLTFLRNFAHELDVPLGYLLWVALSESPTPEEKSLRENMDNLLVELLRHGSVEKKEAG